MAGVFERLDSREEDAVNVFSALVEETQDEESRAAKRLKTSKAEYQRRLAVLKAAREEVRSARLCWETSGDDADHKVYIERLEHAKELEESMVSARSIYRSDKACHEQLRRMRIDYKAQERSVIAWRKQRKEQELEVQKAEARKEQLEQAEERRKEELEAIIAARKAAEKKELSELRSMTPRQLKNRLARYKEKEQGLQEKVDEARAAYRAQLEETKAERGRWAVLRASEAEQSELDRAQEALRISEEKLAQLREDKDAKRVELDELIEHEKRIRAFLRDKKKKKA